VTLFRYEQRLLERFPTTVGGLLHGHGLTNGPSSPALAAEYRREQEDALERIGGQSLGSVPSLAAWRRAFTGFGVEPTRYRNAAEALLRRLTKHGNVPSVNAVVDIANLVSIRYALPVAVLDLAGVTGTITVRFAEGSEEFEDLGAREVEHPDPGEVVFVDEAAVVHARRWCWRQSARSATGPETEEILVTVEGHHETASEDVPAALADLQQLLPKHASAGEVEHWVLTAG
jgi:DNA/RNA-binding domain of Phe-tRNA-synthetase-like protein